MHSNMHSQNEDTLYLININSFRSIHIFSEKIKCQILFEKKEQIK